MEVSPVMKRARARPGEEYEERGAEYGYQIEGEEEYEFGNLAEGEGRVDRGAGGLAEHLDCVRGIVKEDTGGRD